MATALKRNLMAAITMAVVVLGLFWIGFEYMQFLDLSETMRKEEQQKRRDQVRRQALSAVSYIRYRIATEESEIRRELQDKVREVRQLLDLLARTGVVQPRKAMSQVLGAREHSLFQVDVIDGDGLLLYSESFSRHVGKPLANLVNRAGDRVGEGLLEFIAAQGHGPYVFRWQEGGMDAVSSRKLAHVDSNKSTGLSVVVSARVSDMMSELKRQVVAVFEHVALTGEEKLFGATYKGVSVLGPAKGRNILDARDSSGANVVRKMVDTAMAGGGFVSYVMPRLDGARSALKLSYVAPVPEWGWYVGTGVYVDQIEKAIALMRENLLSRLLRQCLLVLGMLVAANWIGGQVMRLFLRRIEDGFQRFYEFFQRSDTHWTSIPAQSMPFEELVEMAEAANRMAEARARIQEELQASEEAYRSIFDATADAFLVFDVESGAVVDVNRSMLGMFQMERDEVLGRTLGDFSSKVSPYTYKAANRLLDEVRRASMPVFFRWQGMRSNAEVFWMACGARTLEVAGVQRILISARDINDQVMAEEALRNSEKMLRSILATVPLGIGMGGKRGMGWGNDRIFEILGFSREEAIGQSPSLLFGTDTERYRMAHGQLEKDLAETGRAWMEERLYRKDGEPYMAEMAFALLDPDSPDGDYIVVVSDITERKQAEWNLAETKALFQAVLEQVPVGITIAEPQGEGDTWRHRVHNATAARLLVGDTPLTETFTVSPAEDGRLQAQVPWTILQLDGSPLEPDDRPVISILRNNEGKVDRDVLIRRADGVEHVVNLNMTPIRIGDNPLAAVANVLLDITDRVQAEEERRRLRALLQSMIDAMPALLVALDGDGCITQWNRQAEDLTGLSLDQARGLPLQDVLPWLRDKAGLVSRALDQREVAEVFNEPVSLPEKQRYVDMAVYPFDVPGEKGAVVRVDDVTERMRIEEMMIQTEKMLSVGGLAAGMAHEINNPLGIILQSVQNARRRVDPDFAPNQAKAADIGLDLAVMRDYLETRGVMGYLTGISEAGDRAARIVRNMLDFSRRNESGMAPCNLADLLDHAVELAGSDYDLKKRFDFRHIEVEREYQQDMPTISCNYTEIEQVVLNLLRNAAQAMGGGRYEDRDSRITLRAGMDPDGMARIEVEDNGPGMDEETRRRIFEPFFTTKEPGVGTGLGLSVSFFIVTQNHKGEFKVESAPGQGARFVIRLPLGNGGTGPA